MNEQRTMYFNSTHHNFPRQFLLLPAKKLVISFAGLYVMSRVIDVYNDRAK